MGPVREIHPTRDRSAIKAITVGDSKHRISLDDMQNLPYTLLGKKMTRNPVQTQLNFSASYPCLLPGWAE